MAEDYVLQTKITADSTQFDATLKKTGKSLTTFSSEITKVTKLLGTLFVGQKIVNFAKTSVDSIEKERKEINLLNTTLKTTGATAWTTQQQLVDMAKAFESESNYTSEQIQRAQTVMLGFKTVTGDVFNSAMQNVLDMSEVMGMDLVSAVQTVGKALDDPVKGLGSLQRQGFAFSESQKAMLEEMVKTGRQAEAQKIILDELATTYGGASKAGQNAFQQLNIAVGNLQKAIGENLAPVVESIATDITELINQFNSFDKGTQTFILTAGSLLTTLPLVVKGINALKVALVSLQTSVPVLLAITAGIAGLSAVVGAVVKKKNEFSELSKEITKISSTTKNYLDTYSEGNEEKKLDEKATKELIKLYPELSGKVSAYTTSVEDARDAVNDLVNKKLVDAESSGIKGYIQRLNDIKKLNEEVNKLTSHKNKLDENMAKEIQNVSIPAIQKLADEERNSINERLKAIGKLLTLEGSIVEIQIEPTPAKNLEETKKSWQEALKEVLKIGGDFSTGKEAVNIYLSNMEEALKHDKRISEALGEKFDISSALKAQQEQIAQVISELLQQTDIDKPFDIEELSKESTALGSLAQAYKEMGEVISSTNQTISEESNEWTDKLLAQEIAILEKRRDNEIERAKNAKKSEDEIYAIRADYVEKINELKVKQLNSQRDAEIKKVKNSKQSAESQKKIISQINEYYDKQIDLMNEATERFTKKSGGFLKAWSKQYEDLAGNWTKTFVDMANIATSAMGEMFEQIGEDLVDGGFSFEDYSAMAVEAVGKILEALAAQLAATAALRAANYDYGSAATAAAGAAAALVAAGTFKAIASSMRTQTKEAKEATASLKEYSQTLEQIKTSWSKTESSTDVLKNIIENQKTTKSLYATFEESSKAMSDAYNRAFEEYQKYKDYDRAWWAIFDDTKDRHYKRYKKLLAEANRLNDINNKNFENYINSLKLLTDGQKKYINSLKETYDYQKDLFSMYKEMYSGKNNLYSQIVYNEQLNNIQSSLTELYESFENIGATLGENIINGVINGTTKSDFTETLKSYIRETLIKLSVYTETFQKSLAESSQKLVAGILGDNNSVISKAVSEIEELYETALSMADKVGDKITKIFGGSSKYTLGSLRDIADEFRNAQLEESKYNSLYNQTLRDRVDAEKKYIDALAKRIAYQIKIAGKNYIWPSSTLSDLKEAESYWYNQLNVQKSLEATYYNEYKAAAENRINLINDTVKALKDENLELDLQNIYYKSFLTNISASSILVETQKNSILQSLSSLYDELTTNAVSIGETIINGIVSGMKKEDLALEIKSYIKNNIVKAQIYSAYADELAELGTLISTSILTPNSSNLTSVSKKLNAIFDGMTTRMETVNTLLDDIFGKEVKSGGEEITQTVSKLTKAMKDFSDTVTDLGGDIASNLINGITNGLSQSDFLSNMKDWLRKMLVQSVVYTETMKTEIEEIGKRISEGITTGFTDTSLHEIRRDLSYIFESASSKMSNIDNILSGVFDGYASGTESATRGLHIVGEAGPELVQFRGGERVYNNRDTMGMISGSNTNNFNVTFNNLRDTSAFAMMNQFKQYNRELAINGVI